MSNKELQIKELRKNQRFFLKGTSMPIETVVIIAIVVLVLVVITAFFLMNSGQQMNSIGDDAALGNGCIIMSSKYSCNLADTTITSMKTEKIPNYFIAQGKQGTMEDVCKKKGYSDFKQCMIDLCHCPK